jgi:dihydrofolate reductase
MKKNNLVLENLNMIMAVSDDSIIGLNDKPFMPWIRRVPEDMNYFRRTTIGKGNNTVIMGRKTKDTIPKKFFPFEERENIILSRSPKETIFETQEIDKNIDTSVMSSMEEILEYIKNNPEKTFWVIGGKEIYDQFLPYVSQVFLTCIHGVFSEEFKDVGIVKIPNIKDIIGEFELLSSKKFLKDEINKFDMTFEVWGRFYN